MKVSAKGQRRHSDRSRTREGARRCALREGRRLVVMVKAPVAGRVKTRLARDIGAVQATWFYRHMLEAVVARLMRASRWETWLAVSPDGAAGLRIWPSRCRVMGQGGGDLGQRLQRVLDWRVRGPMVIIGTDIPGVCESDIGDAFRALGTADAVIGPAPDGGYWMIGARRMPRVPSPFKNVRWSSAHTRADTLANFHGRRVAILRMLTDVDTAEEWRSARNWAGRRVMPVAVRGNSGQGKTPSVRPQR